MAIITLKQLSEMTGRDSRHLSMCRIRGNIIETNAGSGLYNTDNKTNKVFIDKELAKKSKPKPEREEIDYEIGEDGVPEIDVSTKLYKHLQTIKTQKEIEKITLDNEKKQGQLVPFDLIQPVFLQHNQSILMSFTNCIDDILRVFGKVKELTNEEASELRGKLRVTINEAMDEADKNTLKSLNVVINNYSITKGVGEHE